MYNIVPVLTNHLLSDSVKKPVQACVVGVQLGPLSQVTHHWPEDHLRPLLQRGVLPLRLRSLYAYGRGGI